MKHLKTFFIFESNNEKSLFYYCEKYLKGTKIWDSMKRDSDVKKASLEILKDPGLESLFVDAQFNYSDSTLEKIVISVNPNQRNNREYRSTMAHELTHALQYIRDGHIDLFNNDATREFRNLSEDPEWEKFMMAIYLVDPLEIEATESEEMHGKNSFVLEMKGWMKKFNPIGFSKYLKSILPKENEWELEDFMEFPDLWSSTYINYEPEIVDKEIVNLKDKSLEEFLMYYNKKFKSYSI